MRSANGGGAGRVTCHCLALLCAAGRAGAECDRSGGAGRWVRGGAGAAGLPGRGWLSVRGPSDAEEEGGGPRRVRRSVGWALCRSGRGLRAGVKAKGAIGGSAAVWRGLGRVLRACPFCPFSRGSRPRPLFRRRGDKGKGLRETMGGGTSPDPAVVVGNGVSIVLGAAL